ncbi:MAG TPA: hypothetical protein VKE51_34750 [Vicinamibacterales bacterium]|nr:hypothetical protein [Vicinamibacterales bacterium]
MAPAYATAHSPQSADVTEGGGSVSTVEALQSCQAGVGITLADVA